jgi:hypothetical protein
MCLILNRNKFPVYLNRTEFISNDMFQSFVMAGIQHEHPGAQNAINEQSGNNIHPVKFPLGGITMRFGPVETGSAAVGLLQETHTSALAYLLPRPS